MSKGFGFLGVIATCALTIVLLAVTGVLSVNWPWQVVDVTSHETAIDASEPARIVEIAPIALDCRARIHAEVPVEGRKEHQVFGQTYRTDSVELHAIGDIDTCVDSSEVTIVPRADGTHQVIIPGGAIQFVRPRVDAHATRDSVDYNKGWVGGFTDVFPWVSDNEGLTPAAYSYAQSVIGGSDCMQAAFDVTEDLLLDAYADQAADQGIDPADVTVEIIGSPDFGQNDAAAPLDEDFDFQVADGESSCELVSDATPEPSDPEPADVELEDVDVPTL